MVLYDIQTNPTYKHAWQFKHLAKHIPVEELIDQNIFPAEEDLQSPYIIHMKITITTLLQTHTKINYPWNYLTKHPNITLEDIQAHPELPWDYTYLMFNPNFEYRHLETFKQHINEFIFYTLSYSATCEQILQNPDKKWLPVALCSEHMQKEHIVKLMPYFQEKHNGEVSRFLFITINHNPNLTFDDLIDLFGEELPLTYAHECPTFTLQDFQKRPLATWKNLTLFQHILPLDFIKAHPNEPWIWSSILENNNTLSYDQFNEFPNIFPDMPRWANEWHMRHMLFNNKHLSHFDKKCILEKDLLYSPIPPRPYNFTNQRLIVSPLFLEPTFEEIKEYFAKKRMVRIIVEAMSNPAYSQCRKRLAREHSGLAREHSGLAREHSGLAREHSGLTQKPTNLPIPPLIPKHPS
jgi:hypothetical protein